MNAWKLPVAATQAVAVRAAPLALPSVVISAAALRAKSGDCSPALRRRVFLFIGP